MYCPKLWSIKLDRNAFHSFRDGQTPRGLTMLNVKGEGNLRQYDYFIIKLCFNRVRVRLVECRPLKLRGF